MVDEQGFAEFTGRNENLETTEEKHPPIHHHSQLLSLGGYDVKKAPVAVDSHSVLARIVRDREVVMWLVYFVARLHQKQLMATSA